MSGAFWILVIWFLISLPIALAVGRAIGLSTRDDEEPPKRDEDEAYAKIYELRSFERRTDVGPQKNTQKWS